MNVINKEATLVTLNPYTSDNDSDDQAAPIPAPSSGIRDYAKQQEIQDDPKTSETHPVFGSAVQPQKINDKEIIGSSSDDLAAPLRGEDSVVGYDPENDLRMQESPTR